MKRILFLLGFVAVCVSCSFAVNRAMTCANAAININDIIAKVSSQNKDYIDSIQSSSNVGGVENDLIKFDGLVFNTDFKRTDDFVNVCYTNTYDCDYLGQLHLTLFSKKEPNSVFYGHNNIRMEFFDDKGEQVLTRNAINKFPEKEGQQQGNSVDVIDKFNLKFGKAYLIKFYDNENNLIGYSFLNVSKPEFSDDVHEFKFKIPPKETWPFLNVCDKNSNNVISDRLKLKFNRVGENNNNVALTIECLSNDNNSDSVFKEHDSLIVDFISSDGKVLLSEKTDGTVTDEHINCVKSKQVTVNITPEFVESGSVTSLNFYDGKDKEKTEPIANFKLSDFNDNKGPAAELKGGVLQNVLANGFSNNRSYFELDS